MMRQLAILLFAVLLWVPVAPAAGESLGGSAPADSSRATTSRFSCARLGMLLYDGEGRLSGGLLTGFHVTSSFGVGVGLDCYELSEFCIFPLFIRLRALLGSGTVTPVAFADVGYVLDVKGADFNDFFAGVGAGIRTRGQSRPAPFFDVAWRSHWDGENPEFRGDMYLVMVGVSF